MLIAQANIDMDKFEFLEQGLNEPDCEFWERGQCELLDDECSKKNLDADICLLWEYAPAKTCPWCLLQEVYEHDNGDLFCYKCQARYKEKT